MTAYTAIAQRRAVKTEVVGPSHKP